MPSLTLNKVLSTICTQHQINIKQNIAYGTGFIEGQEFHILGTVENTFLGVDEAIIIAESLLNILAQKDNKPVLLLIDVIGQKLAMRDEWLGMYAYFAHVLECTYLVRKNHTVISLIYNQAIGGSFIAFGSMSHHILALSDATVAVMWLEAMAKVTKLDETLLKEISKTSPVFAPGVENFKQLGGIHDVISLEDAANKINVCSLKAQNDNRALLGYQLGGRKKAYPLIEKLTTL